MSNSQQSTQVKVIRFLQKFVVSTFVVFSFLAYAVHERLSPSDAAANTLPPTPDAAAQTVPDAPQAQLTPQVSFGAPGAPTAPPAPTTAPSPMTAQVKTNGQYKDGSYTGPQVNAFWGMVQVKAVVQNGKLANVQVLQYPSDRRTSVRINSIALPDLQSEAIQAQNANVDMISGATLTSQAFIQSLQAALTKAKS